MSVIDWDYFDWESLGEGWICDLCGGVGFREYLGAPDEWGEDCPSEINHLIPCRGCAEIERAKLEYIARHEATETP